LETNDFAIIVDMKANLKVGEVDSFHDDEMCGEICGEIDYKVTYPPILFASCLARVYNSANVRPMLLG